MVGFLFLLLLCFSELVAGPDGAGLESSQYSELCPSPIINASHTTLLSHYPGDVHGVKILGRALAFRN